MAVLSEQNRVASEPWENAELFRATFNQAAVGIAHIDLEGKWIRINRKLCEIVGYSEEELRHLSFRDITHPDDVAASIDNYQRALADDEFNNYSLEKRYLHKNGAPVWVNVTVSLIRSAPSVPGCFVVVVEDITPRKEAEEKLKKVMAQAHEQARILAAILAASPNQILHIDRDGRYRYMSRAALNSIGMTPEQVIGKRWQDLGFPPQIMGRIDRERERVLASGEEARGDITMPTSRGNRNFEYAINAIPGKEEENAGVVITAWDITEHKRAEEEIEILYNDLLARAFDMEAANKELEAFNYTVSHDLRKPLTIINGYCQAILELFADNLNPQCLQYLREIYDWTLRMNSLIDALLRFSRLSHCELHREKVDLSSIAAEVSAQLKSEEPGRQTVFLISEGIEAAGDPYLLRVVLENLLGNAWKYAAEREDAVIEFARTKGNGNAVYSVRDNGAGFDMAHVTKLFIPFQRLPGTQQFKGNGIGLATVERIIRRHGGRVWAEGELGKGATFFFTLL